MRKPKVQGPKSEAPTPNIAFVGREKNHFEPLLVINNGDTTIVLPEDQSKPFFHAEAAKIIRLFPDRYKPVTPKG